MLWIGFIRAWPQILGFLSALLLVSGLEDLVPTIICAWHWIRRQPFATPSPDADSERRIAIFVPCWKESAVIGNMIRHNVASIAYRNYDFFLGVYPNDTPTVEAARQLASTFRRVHVAACPHDGPTSKADCLNWVFQRMLEFEREESVHFDTILLHDAEDLIHPQALSVINRERAAYDMVQVPVLPLPTGIDEFTHGVYCDDFSEFQFVDMPARQFSRAFVPSNGVGTGFAREVLDRLALERGSAVFNPASLTEDYEIGVYIHRHGYRQLFVPLTRVLDEYCATREYFPRRVRSAIRQRTRWVTGIALQSWARDGWRGSWTTKYWFWRDRKGLLANPLSLATNILFLLGACDWAAARLQHRPWVFAVSNPLILQLCLANSAIQVVRLVMRSCYTARIFGPAMGLTVPLRAFYGNFINSSASIAALWQYSRARAQRRPLAWQKTDHAYPGRDMVAPKTQRLADLLVENSYLPTGMLQKVQEELQSDGFLGEFLVSRGLISDHELCSALSLQTGVPFSHVHSEHVNRLLARTLPRYIEKRFSVVPFALETGRLFVAGCRVPGPELYDAIRRCTPLPIEFHLVTQGNYNELKALL